MNDTARTPTATTAEPSPDSAPPRGTFNTPQAPARPPALAWVHDEVLCGTAARFRELVGGVPVTMHRVLLPARLDAAQVFDGKVVHGGCVIIDDPYPTPPRFEGTRAQRRLAATRAVQRARKHRRTLHALLARWVRGDLQSRMRSAYQEMAAYADKLAWDGVPSGPYDPAPVTPVYLGVVTPGGPGVTCV